MSAAPPEVLIAGAGPAGAIAARVLAAAGAPVIIADAGHRHGPRVGESLAPAARRILVELDLMHTVADHLICPGNLSAWGNHELFAADHVRGLDGAGWQLDRARFDAALLAAAAAAGARVLAGTRVLDARRAADHWRVTVADAAGARTLRCRVLIDATGRRARLARLAGGARLVRDDEQVARVATFRTADDRDARTLVESVADGWWYTAAAPDHRRVVGFITRPELADRTFTERLAATTYVVEALRRVAARPLAGPRWCDASGTHLEPAAGPGWLAVGDAALAFDPLSSQGLFDALYSGLQGARAVLAGDAASYVTRLASIREAYRRGRAEQLARETRWPDAPFWRPHLRR